MIHLVRGIFQHGEDVLGLKAWIIFQDFLMGSAVAQQFEHVSYADSQSANAWSSAALAGFYGNPSKPLEIHTFSLTRRYAM